MTTYARRAVQLRIRRVLDLRCENSTHRHLGLLLRLSAAGNPPIGPRRSRSVQRGRKPAVNPHLLTGLGETAARLGTAVDHVVPRALR
jgi:hypothetical protein